ncbi:NAD(P)-dependent alcohol dehydrogenase [Glycomyces tarimensis]
MSTTMRAIVHYRYGPPEVLHRADIAPPVPGADDVLVRVHTAGLGAEIWHLTTGLPYLVRAGTGLRRPARPVPGRDLAGVVASIGADVTGFTAGDEVFGVGVGSFAEYCLASPRTLARKPPGVDFARAAVAPVSGVAALKAVRDTAAVQPGQHVMVIGAGGGVGTFAVQIAKALGAEVTGVCSGAKADAVTAIGADHVIDYTRGEPDGATRYDAIIDTAGHRSIRRLSRLLTARGTLVAVGSEAPGKWLGGLDRLVRARAASAFSRRTLTGMLSTENRADLESLADMLADGALSPVIGRTHPLDEVPDALRNLREGRALGKTAITVADDGPRH